MDLELPGIVSYCSYYSVATTHSHSRKTHCLRCPRAKRAGPLCLLIWGNLISTYLMHAPDLHWGDTRSCPRSQPAHAPVDSGHAAPSPRPCKLLLLSGCRSRCSLLVLGTEQSGCVRMADHDRNSSRRFCAAGTLYPVPLAICLGAEGSAEGTSAGATYLYSIAVMM